MNFTLKKYAFAAFSALALSFYAADAADAASVSVMNGDHDVITNGPGLASFGHTSTLFQDSLTGHSDAIAAGNTIIIEERGLDAASVAAYQSFMNAGGRVILLGSYFTTGETFFNNVFGTSIDFADAGGGCCGGAPFNQTAAVAGTTFAGGPASLETPSSTHRVLSGLPGGAEVFYENGVGEAVVFRMTLGAGDLFYMGWDYCCGNSTQEAAYYDVLDSAIRFDDGTPPAVPLPAGGILMLSGLVGLGALRRRKQQRAVTS